ITAKDFRTWAGTVLAALALQPSEASSTQSELKKSLRSAIEGVAARLGNTPTICRKCYVHPEIFAAHGEGVLRLELSDELAGLKPEEAAVLRLLETRLNRSLNDQLQDSLAAARRK
ncbi:MAG TPA: DNA topoisomerase IB, partial [Ramlibacter sp.]|nr:DNA topoisomerase IB [Ramlibacter sp.]